jgi:hypothetical protein
MTFTTRLLLSAAAMAVLLQMQHSEGFQSVGGGGGGGGVGLLWTFDTPVDGGSYAVCPGYMGGGVNGASATLAIFGVTNTNPNGTFPSELNLLRSCYVTTADADVWVSSAGPEVGNLFATITPNPGEETTVPLNPLAVSAMIEEGEVEQDARTIISSMSGDSVAFFVQGGLGNGNGGGGGGGLNRP